MCFRKISEHVDNLFFWKFAQLNRNDHR
jgi:hypothetical protein